MSAFNVYDVSRKTGFKFFHRFVTSNMKVIKPRAKPTQALGKRSSVTAPMETLRSKDGESNRKVVKATGQLTPMSVTQDDLQKKGFAMLCCAENSHCQASRCCKPTTLHVPPTFLSISLQSLHDYDVKLSHFTF